VNPRDYYDAMYAEHRPRPATGLPGFFARLTLDREEAVLRLVSDGGRLLDVGCGEGWLVLAAASRFSEAYGIDISGVRIGRAQARVQESDSSRIRLQVVDVSEGLPFDDGYFDAVSCVATLEHVFSPVAVAREMWRVLRPGGEIVIAASNAAYAVSRVPCPGNHPGGRAPVTFWMVAFSIISPRAHWWPCYETPGSVSLRRGVSGSCGS